MSENNHRWCVGCSPDNCSGCGTEPVAYIFKPNNELLWPHEVDQNVFAADPEDYDLLYTTPQPGRVVELETETTKLKLDLLTSYGESGELSGKVAELEKALKVVSVLLHEYKMGNTYKNKFVEEALVKINEVLKP